jgi:hypothetical protein
MRPFPNICGALLLCGAGISRAGPAKSDAQKLHDFGLSGSNVGTPGYGRVLLVFALIVALAWGATWLLRRYGARFRAGAIGAAGPVKHIARDTLPGGVVCHVIETQGRQVLITVTRHGVASVLLGVAPGAPPSDRAS